MVASGNKARVTAGIKVMQETRPKGASATQFGPAPDASDSHLEKLPVPVREPPDKKRPLAPSRIDVSQIVHHWHPRPRLAHRKNEDETTQTYGTKNDALYVSIPFIIPLPFPILAATATTIISIVVAFDTAAITTSSLPCCQTRCKLHP